MWTNFHTHSEYCDGRYTLEKYVESAVRLGLTSLGFSSHAPLPFATNWAMDFKKLPYYITEISRLKEDYRNSIQIYSGLEVDYIPGKSLPNNALWKNLGLDYTIGSIHFIDEFDDGTPWEMDNKDLFDLGLEKIFKGDIKSLVSRYYELTREMVRLSPPTIVGHLDKIKIYNRDYYIEYDSWYQQEVKKTLKEISKSDSIIEVNTRGLYKFLTKQPYPSRWILEEIYKLRIPITVNSDAHHIAELITLFDKALVILWDIGFKEVVVLEDGEWKSVPLDDYWTDSLKYA